MSSGQIFQQGRTRERFAIRADTPVRPLPHLGRVNDEIFGELNQPPLHRQGPLMTIEEAREILGLGLKATRKEIRTAYRQAARRWHPDRAPAGVEADYRARMQQINAAYQRIVKLLEDYRYELVDTETPEDLQKWWASRFYTGVWSPPPDPGEEKD